MPMRLTLVVPRAAYAAAVEALTGINAAIVQVLDGRIPLLYESGVRYREPGKERWQTIAELYDRGAGDCKDLAAARAAELRYFEGELARPVVYEITAGRNGQRRFHAVVERADGTIEDPSRVLLAIERGLTNACDDACDPARRW